jgi:AICAR transformylase/IMP cyclohydrolase PurH
MRKAVDVHTAHLETMMKAGDNKRIAAARAALAKAATKLRDYELASLSSDSEA